MKDENPKSNDYEERLEDHEAELAAEEAEQELKEETRRMTEKEYQRMAADLRWEVLAYIDAHPDKTVLEVARRFGLKEGTIRAWKAHRTMGTYRGQGRVEEKAGSRPPAPLFRPRRKEEPGSSPPFTERKRVSHFIHLFDKTPPGIVCPHFYILAHANGCPFFCDYCYLRLTLRHYPEPTVFSNTARMFQELRDWLFATEEPSVLNTGELCDSLAWDLETSLSVNLIPLFANQDKHKVLFLTKSTAIENLLEMEPTPQAVVSFSVNAREVSAKFERKAPNPEERLAAARQLKEAGWEVRIRIDPILPVPGWKEAYEPLIREVNELDPKVVTLGTLRFFPNLLAHAPKNTEVFSFGKDHHDPDGRWRVDEDLRAEIYSFFLERLRPVRVGLCKETAKMHERLGLPGENQSCNCTLE